MNRRQQPSITLTAYLFVDIFRSVLATPDCGVSGYWNSSDDPALCTHASTWDPRAGDF
jgi:hypothetical protein